MPPEGMLGVRGLLYMLILQVVTQLYVLSKLRELYIIRGEFYCI